MIEIGDTTVYGNAAIDAGNATVVKWEDEKYIGIDSVDVMGMTVTGSLTVKTGNGLDEVGVAGLISGVKVWAVAA